MGINSISCRTPGATGDTSGKKKIMQKKIQKQSKGLQNIDCTNHAIFKTAVFFKLFFKMVGAL